MRGGRRSGATRSAVAVGVLVGALAATPARSRAEPAPCRLAISVAQRVAAPGRPSAPILVGGAVRTPWLAASAGAIEDLRREAGEGFSARWLPPRDGLTRAAVIGAATGDGACGLTVVRLADGPPAGPALPPPVAVLLQPAPAREGGDVEVRAWIFAVDEAGAPRGGAPPALKVGAGTITAAEPACPGAWSARWRLPAARAAGEPLTATFPGGAAATARLTLRLASLDVALDPPRLARSAYEPVVVRVRGWDDLRRPVDAEVIVTSSAGTVSRPRRLEQGAWQAGLTVRPGAHGGGPATVRARAGDVEAKAELAFGPGAPASLRIEGPDALVCDGTSSMLVVSVADAQGNPVDDAEPALEAGQAELGVPHHAAPGQWWISYRPRCAATAGSDLVVARAGGMTTQRAIRLAAPASGLGIGAKAGLALQGAGVGPSIGAEVAAWTRLGGQQVGLALEVARWSVTSRGAIDGLGDYADERTYLPVLLSAAWQRPLGARLQLSAGAGGGAAQVATRNRLAAQPAVTAAGWAPAASGALALGRWAAHGVAFAELRATWIGDPGLPTLRGALTSFQLLAGYRFHGW